MGEGCSGHSPPCHPSVWHTTHLGSLQPSLVLRRGTGDYGHPRPGPSDTFSKIAHFHSFLIITLFNLKNTESLIIAVFSRERNFAHFCYLFHVQTSFLYLLVVMAIANHYCVDQLLLHNKISPNSKVQKNNKHLLWFTMCVDLGMAKLGESGLGSLSWVCSHDIGWDCSHPKAWLGMENLLLAGLLTWPTAVCGKPPFLFTWSFPWSCWSVPTT